MLGGGGVFHEPSMIKNQSVIRLDLHRGTVNMYRGNVFNKFWFSDKSKMKIYFSTYICIHLMRRS